MPQKTHKVAAEKKEAVKKILRLIKEYPIVGVVNMENLPTAQLQRMRHQLRGKIELFMTKITLTKLAIEEAKKIRTGIDALEPYVKGVPALLFTKDNPFLLYKTLKKSKSPAAAKAGQVAPKDLVVPAGPTPFTPGPVISEFAALGIKAGVEGGKVAVKQDVVVCKEGMPISAPLASMLARLGITPMEIGLDLVAVFENGIVYARKILDVDEKAFMGQIMQAASESFNLAIEISLPTKDTIELLVQKGFREAKAVALEGNIMADAIAQELVEKAEREMIAIKNAANITVTEHQKETAQETPKDKIESAVDKMVGDLKKHEIPKPNAQELVKEAKDKDEQGQKLAKEKKEIDDVSALAKKLVNKGSLR